MLRTAVPLAMLSPYPGTAALMIPEAMLRRFLANLTRPAPLVDFADYDAYWALRAAGSESPPLLYRHTRIAERIPARASVLDIGCGAGVFLRHMRDARPDCDVVGADISADVVAQLRADGFTAHVIDSARSLSEQFAERFDVVVAMEVIEHVQDAEALVREAAALASQRLYLTLPNAGFITHRLRLAIFGRFPITSVHCHIKEHIRFWTVTDFREWCAALGLALVGVEPQLRTSASRLPNWLGQHFPSLFAALLIYEIDTLGEGR